VAKAKTYKYNVTVGIKLESLKQLSQKDFAKAKKELKNARFWVQDQFLDKDNKNIDFADEKVVFIAIEEA
jgi:hypothetical protein